MNCKLYLYKRVTLGAFLLLFVTLTGGFSEEKKVEADYITDLSSKEDQLVILACKKLGEIKSKNAIQALVKTLDEHENPRVRIVAASSLGQTEAKGDPTDALKEAIENDESNDVVYSALLAIGNLKDFDNPNVKASLEYCEENKKDDPFIKDIVVRVRKFLEGK